MSEKLISENHDDGGVRYRFYRHKCQEMYAAIDAKSKHTYISDTAVSWYDGVEASRWNGVVRSSPASVSQEFLDQDCTPVARSEVPAEWLAAIGYPEE